MKYLDSKGNELNKIHEWQQFVFKQNKKEKHWKEGRSAYEIANFLMNKDGETQIKAVVEEIVNESVNFEYGIPEMEVRFDCYGHGREHDVGVFAKTESGKRVFLGIESKVDETFKETIAETYLNAKSRELSGISTNLAVRIEQLLKKNFTTVNSKHFDLRYQLLYSTIGTLEAKEQGKYADIYFLIIIVFKTELYDESKGLDNYKDYIQFLNALSSKQMKKDGQIDIHEVIIENRTLNTIYMTIDA